MAGLTAGGYHGSALTASGAGLLLLALLGSCSGARILLLPDEKGCGRS